MTTPRYGRMAAWDPGVLASGLAVFENDRLTEAEAVIIRPAVTRPIQWSLMATSVAEHVGKVDLFAFEQMQTRKGKEAAHTDLIELSIISGIVVGLLSVRFLNVPANTWTKGRQKPVNHARIREILEPEELRVLDTAIRLCPRKENHKEILDAVGIGLYALRRWS